MNVETIIFYFFAAVLVFAALRVQAAETRAQGGFLFRIQHRDLAPEQVAAGDGHALHQLQEQVGFEEAADSFDHRASPI